jgi:acyl-coenzyme A thioesterase PaaI-like protein
VEPRTHLAIDRRLCGEPLDLPAAEDGVARVALTTLPEMAVDAEGLVHGGFVFGLADHAAMLAVNHPHVVLGSAAVRFEAPVAVGDHLVAEARRQEVSGRKCRVLVEVRRRSDENRGEVVLSGELTCLTLDRHVLAGRRGA